MELKECLRLETRIFEVLFELIDEGLIDRLRGLYLIVLQRSDNHFSDGINRSVHVNRPFSVPHDELHEVVIVLLQGCLGSNLNNLITRRIRSFLSALHFLFSQFQHFYCQHFLRHMQSFGAVFDIHLPRNDIRDDGNGGGDIFDEFRTLVRIIACIFAQQFGLKPDEVGLMLLDIANELRRVMILRITIRIFSIGQ